MQKTPTTVGIKQFLSCPHLKGSIYFFICCIKLTLDLILNIAILEA